MTVFLIVVGLTGSMLAFKTDLERLICPRIYATPRPGVPPLDLATLAERAEARVPQGQVVTVYLENPIKRWWCSSARGSGDGQAL